MKRKAFWIEAEGGAAIEVMETTARDGQPQIALAIHDGESMRRVFLTGEAFHELCDLKYDLPVNRASQCQPS